MINKLIDGFLNILDWFYNTFDLEYYFDFWNTLTGDLAAQHDTLQTILNGIYFFMGKNLVVFVWNFAIAVFCLAIIFAIINLIAQFIP